MNSRSLLSAAILTLVLPMTSCEVYDRLFWPQPPGNAADPAAVVPKDFLFSRYAPLNAWLDEAVRVQIMDVPLMEVFNHQTLRGLNYVFVKKPQKNPLVTMDKLALTRRQLLWALSHDHQLHMTPSFGANGEVTCIEIRSRSVDLPEVRE